MFCPCTTTLLPASSPFSTRKYPPKAVAEQIREAVDDAYKRLLEPSISNEVIKEAKERADIESIKVFGENLRQLLLAPPVGQKRMMAIDPGFRTGCKVVCLDAQGNLLHNETIYPHPPANEKVKSIQAVSAMIQKYGIEAIAIGKGTAGRETEEFIRRVPMPKEVRIFPVSEDGASIYSASETAREEFPDYDVTVRGAVSIGRRVMDPLAELVKIDPKSLGVGQYQHDVDQTLLKEKLDNTVESCVNSVGVNLNTASRHLLSYVSGIGPALAENIRNAYNKAYFHADGGYYDRNSQCANSIALCAGLVEPQNEKAVLDNIVADIRRRGNALSAGDVGYNYVLRALESRGQSQVIYDMNSRYDRFGYGNQIAHGATALPETWDSRPEKSHNHLMLGHLQEWFYSQVGGIQRDTAATAFKRIVIRPSIVGGISFARTGFMSPYGEISTDWNDSSERFRMEVTVPANTTARIYVPAAEGDTVTESGIEASKAQGVRAAGSQEGYRIFETGSGTYRFEVDKR